MHTSDSRDSDSPNSCHNTNTSQEPPYYGGKEIRYNFSCYEKFEYFPIVSPCGMEKLLSGATKDSKFHEKNKQSK